jgi:magnesium chelatase subunit D
MIDVAARWADALLAARLFASDPCGFGGIIVRAPAGPVRDLWLDALRAQLRVDRPFRKMPVAIADDQLLGGLDLTATLSSGRPVPRKGLLAETDGGVILIPMAERLADATGRLCLALDTGRIIGERDGMAIAAPARVGLILCDEGASDEEGIAAALADRCTFLVDLTMIGPRDAMADPGVLDLAEDTGHDSDRPFASDAQLETLCGLAVALGLMSMRPAQQALRVAQALAATAQRSAPDEQDIVTAARLVLAPRALRVPAAVEDSDNEQEPPPPPPDEGEGGGEREDQQTGQLADVVLEAVRAALPPDLMAALDKGEGNASRLQGHGAGAVRKSLGRGRPAGVRRGEPGGQARLHLIETLRAAAPWQPIRQRLNPRPGIIVGRDDFRIRRYAERAEATMIFAVDASGSAALERLAETKGAVELLLAEAYVRRTHVALIAFRGERAELLLPPTRSLARAKKCLAGLAGGGGTPLAAGVEASLLVAEAARRKGRTPFVIMMTDGRANIARDGTPGREQANADAMAAASRFRLSGVAVAMVDIAARPRDEARRFAAALGARYAALPRADAGAMRDIARALEPGLR